MELLVLLAFTLAFQEHDNVTVSVPNFGNEGLVLFSEKEIARAKVECYQNPLGGPDIEQFEITKKEALELVDRFRRSKIDKSPDLTMKEICSIRIIDKNGRSQRINVYWGNAKQPTICYSINGVRCICLVETRNADGKPQDHALIVDGRIRAYAEKRRNAKVLFGP